MIEWTNLFLFYMWLIEWMNVVNECSGSQQLEMIKMHV